MAVDARGRSIVTLFIAVVGVLAVVLIILIVNRTPGGRQGSLSGQWLDTLSQRSVTFDSDGWTDAFGGGQQKYEVMDASTVRVLASDGSQSLYKMTFEGADKVTLSKDGLPLVLLRSGSNAQIQVVSEADQQLECETIRSAFQDMALMYVIDRNPDPSRSWGYTQWRDLMVQDGALRGDPSVEKGMISSPANGGSRIWTTPGNETRLECPAGGSYAAEWLPDSAVVGDYSMHISCSAHD